MDDPVAEVEGKALEGFELWYLHKRSMRVRVQARKGALLWLPPPFTSQGARLPG